MSVRRKPLTVYDIGDVVEWTSHSKSVLRTKRGTIKFIVPAGRSAAVYGIRNPGFPRNDVSYIVEVNGRLYWPRTVHLKKVDNG